MCSVSTGGELLEQHYLVDFENLMFISKLGHVWAHAIFGALTALCLAL